jgi:hypothetical protein
MAQASEPPTLIISTDHWPPDKACWIVISWSSSGAVMVVSWHAATAKAQAIIGIVALAFISYVPYTGAI